MKTIRSACQLQPKALEINVGDQIEQLDQIIQDTNGQEYFKKTFITDGMKTLLSRGMARLAGKSNDTVFHLKQAMGGGKTHLMVGFGLLAKDAALREVQIGDTPTFGVKLPSSWERKVSLGNIGNQVRKLRMKKHGLICLTVKSLF
jgi:hypothetical protein